MSFLVGWLHALISLVLLLALAELILPEGTMRPYVRVILGAVLVIAILRPVVELGAFQWRLPALSLPAAVHDRAVAEGQRLAGGLHARARAEVERQVALQAARLVEVRVGLVPERVAVELSPEGWVEAMRVSLGAGARAGGGQALPQAPAPVGRVAVTWGGSPVQPVTVPPIRVGPAPVAGEGPSGGEGADPGRDAPAEDVARQVQAVLAAFYQIPLERVQVRP